MTPTRKGSTSGQFYTIPNGKSMLTTAEQSALELTVEQTDGSIATFGVPLGGNIAIPPRAQILAIDLHPTGDLGNGTDR